MKEEIRQDGKTVLSSEDGSYSCIVKGKTSQRDLYLRQRRQDRYDEKQARYQDRGIRDRHR